MRSHILRTASLASLLLIAILSQAQLPAAFQSLLNKMSLTYKPTDGLEPVTVLANPVFAYDYAIKYSSLNFEVRYALHPYDALEDERERANDSGDPVADMKRRCANAMADIAISINNGKGPDIKLFHPESVKNEFNADWGASTFFEIDSPFARGYSYCMIVALHKEKIGDVYIFYLSDNVEEFQKLMEPPFHAVKFQ